MATRSRSCLARARCVLAPLWAGALWGSAFWACAEAQQLVPAPGVATHGGVIAVQSRHPAGVTVEADAGAWRDEHLASLDSPAVKLTIANEASTPIHVSYADVSLVGAKETLPAISPQAVKVHPLRTTLGDDPGLPEPGIGPIDTRRPVPLDSVSPDNVSGDASSEVGGDRVTTQAAKREALRASLPEGTIPPGHTVEGYVYFDRLPQADRHLDLELEIKGSENGPVLTTVALPFSVGRD